jgi:hypothetical protein
LANESPSDGQSGPPVLVPAAGINAPPSETGAEALAKVRAMKKKKLAIVGFAPSSYKDAPFQFPEWEVWGLNEAYTLPGFSRADRWFEIHIRQEVDISTRDPNHIAWLRSRRDMPIYMIRSFPDIPMSVEYPLRQVVQKWGQYLTNSITDMILLGVEEGFETIGVWGVDMAQGGVWGQPSEYAEQRPSCEWALGIAQGRGIHVYIPPASDLLKSPGIYGWEGDGSQMRMKIRGRSMELQGRIQGLAQNLAVLDSNRIAALGENTFIDRLNAFLKDHPNPPQSQIDEFTTSMRAQITQAINTWVGQINTLSVQKHQLEGAADDCLYWLRKYVLPTFSADVIAGIDDIKRSPVLEEFAPKPEAPKTEPVITTPSQAPVEGAVAVQ